MQSLSLSSKFNPLQQPGSFRTYAWPMTQVHGVVKSSPINRSTIKCSSQSFFYSTNQNNLKGAINKRIHKHLNKFDTPSALQDDLASQSETASNFLDVFKKKLIAICHLTRFYVQLNHIYAIISVCFLPLRSFSLVTPTFLMGVLKAVAPVVMNISFVNSLNQICDVEIDKINKPYLPLASGDLSMMTGIAICVGSALLSIAFGVASRSPAIFWATISWLIIGVGYSTPFPFLRWKSDSFMAPFSMAVLMGPVLQIYFFIHSQKYVLGEPFIVTRPLIFATTIMSIFGFVNGLLKDLPDVEGDKAFGMRTLCVCLGKEKVLSLSINLLLLGYGSAIIFGIFASSMTNKLVTIISHIIVAFIMWRQSKKVDFDKFESTFGFYMFLWKLSYIEYILIHFVR